MSHLVKGQSKITDIDVLRQALQNMGLGLRNGGRPRFYYDQSEAGIDCDYVVPLPGKYDLGLKMNESTGTYDMVCDSELLSGSYGRGSEGRKILGENAEKLVNEYAWVAAQQEAAQNNYAAARSYEADGTQVIILERYQ